MTYGSKYSRTDQVKFLEDNLLKAVFHNFTWSILEHLDPEDDIFLGEHAFQNIDQRNEGFCTC